MLRVILGMLSFLAILVISFYLFDVFFFILSYPLLSFFGAFCTILGYRIRIDVIPPWMDLLPCDAVFLGGFQRLETAVLKGLASTVFVTAGLAPHRRPREATRRPVAHVANLATREELMCGETQC